MAFVNPAAATLRTSSAQSACPIRATDKGAFVASRAPISATIARSGAGGIRCTVAEPESATRFVDTARAYTVIVTGASSSIGMYAAKTLVERGDTHVVMACRDVAKGENAARSLKFSPGSYTVLELDLSSLDSVRRFVTKFQQGNFRGLSSVVCNAATWHPKDKESRVTVDGFDETIQVNHLGHFLLVNLLMPRLKMSNGRVVFLATETHNPDTLPGKIPPQADLGDLSGLENGLKSGPRTIDGKAFEPTKVYKDSKVCNILTMREMDKRFSKQGVTVAAVFPGCIAESGLFREKRGWFRWLFPLFQKYITRQFVSTEEAGRRVAQVAIAGQFSDSGLYWQWRGSYMKGTADTEPTPIPPTEREASKAERLWDLSSQLVGL